MAQDTFRIEININATDNTESGTKSASSRLGAFEKSMQKTQDRLNKLTGGKWTIGLEAVDKATASINKVTSRVNGLVGKAWNITMGVVDKVTAPVRGILNILKNPILQAGAVLGVSFGLKDTIDTFAAFESTMSKVKAISGATAAEMSLLTDKAKQMGATTKFTATEAGEAFSYMAMAGWKTEDMMNGIEGIMSLAAASGEDLARTSDIVTDALTAFGLTAADSGHFADILAAASSNANTNVAMMGETFKYVAPIFGSLYGEGERAAKGMEDAALGIGLMANAGIKSTQAGTALRSILTRLSTNAGATKNSLGALDILTQRLGVSFYDDAGAVRNFEDILTEARAAWAGLSAEQATSYAKTIAGQYAMSGWLAMMNAAPADVYKLTKAIQGADGAAKEMQDTMLDNLSGSMKLLQSAAESVKLIGGERMSPYLREFIEWMTAQMPALGDAVNRAFDKVDAKIAEVRRTIAEFTSGADWANADLFGKIHIAWDKLIAEPFSSWFAGKAESIGQTIGSGLSNIINALLGASSETVDAAKMGVSIGASLLRGFKEGFKINEIWDSVRAWAGEHKVLATGIGSVLGLNLVSGLANKITSLATFTQLLGKPAQSLGSLGSAAPALGGGVSSSTAMTVNITGSKITVNGASVVVNGYRSRKKTPLSDPIPESPTNENTLPGYVIQKNTGWTSVNSAYGRFLRLGSKEVDVKADGTLRSVTGGVGGTLGAIGTRFGSRAATAAGTATAGLASIGGIIAAGASLVSSAKDFYRSGQYEKEGNAKAAEANRASGALKIGGVATGAIIGATIGSVVPVIGTGVGAAVGAGIGGIAGWLGGNKVKANYEKEVEEAAKLEAIAVERAAEAQARLSVEQQKAKFSSQELKDALSDTAVSADEFSRMFDRVVSENIRGRFGDIKLEAEEISSLVTKLVNTGDFEGLTAFERAKAQAKNAYQSMQDSIQGLDKLNWKIGLGLELDATELGDWRSGMEAVYADAKSYVENAHWEASAAVKLLVDADSEVDFSTLDTAYAQINERLNSLGKDYKAKIKLAMEDGVITLDEQAEIQNLQNQITAITDKVANIEAAADMKALQIKYSGASLDYDSFVSLQRELEAQVEEMTASYDEALKVSIASLELQLDEGVIDQSQYDAQLQALAEGYHGKISDLQIEVEGFQLDAIANAYEAELSGILPELEGTTAEKLRQALNAALAADIDVTGLSSEQIAGWLGLDESLALETQEEISRLLQSVAETLPDNMAQSIASGFEHADISGVPVDGLVNPVLQEITDRLAAGAAEQDYSATGAGVVNGAAGSIESADRGPINSAVEGVRNDTDNALNSAFAPPFHTEATVNVHATYILENPTMDFRPSYQKGTVSFTANAWGGVKTKPELGMVAEAGPEAIVPLSKGKSARGVAVWRQAGEILGVLEKNNAPSASRESPPPLTEIPRHAEGGILTRPHIGMVAEEGPEAIVPLSKGKSARGVVLWRQAGEILGVLPRNETPPALSGVSPSYAGMPQYAEGGIPYQPHIGMVAEAGPEAVIPLSRNKNAQGVAAWRQAGEILNAYRNESSNAESYDSAHYSAYGGNTYAGGSLFVGGNSYRNSATTAEKRTEATENNYRATNAVGPMTAISRNAVGGAFVAEKRTEATANNYHTTNAVGGSSRTENASVTNRFSGGATFNNSRAGAVSAVVNQTGGASFSSVRGGSSYGGADVFQSETINSAFSDLRGDSYSVANGGNENNSAVLQNVRNNSASIKGGSRMTIIGIHPHALGGIMTQPHIALIAENGPEAVIPLSPAKSERGMEMWRRAGDILGASPGEISAYAAGGDNAPSLFANSAGADTPTPDMAFSLIPAAASAGSASLSEIYADSESAEIPGASFNTEQAEEAPPNPGWTALYSQLNTGSGDSVGVSPEVATVNTEDTDGGGNAVNLQVHIDQRNEYRIDGKGLDESKVVAIIEAHSLDNLDATANEIAKRVEKALSNIPLRGRA